MSNINVSVLNKNLRSKIRNLIYKSILEENVNTFVKLNSILPDNYIFQIYTEYELFEMLVKIYIIFNNQPKFKNIVKYILNNSYMYNKFFNHMNKYYINIPDKSNDHDSYYIIYYNLYSDVINKNDINIEYDKLEKSILKYVCKSVKTDFGRLNSIKNIILNCKIHNFKQDNILKIYNTIAKYFYINKSILILFRIIDIFFGKNNRYPYYIFMYIRNYLKKKKSKSYIDIDKKFMHLYLNTITTKDLTYEDAIIDSIYVYLYNKYKMELKIYGSEQHLEFYNDEFIEKATNENFDYTNLCMSNIPNTGLTWIVGTNRLSKLGLHIFENVNKCKRHNISGIIIISINLLLLSNNNKYIMQVIDNIKTIHVSTLADLILYYLKENGLFIYNNKIIKNIELLLNKISIFFEENYPNYTNDTFFKTNAIINNYDMHDNSFLINLYKKKIIELNILNTIEYSNYCKN